MIRAKAFVVLLAAAAAAMLLGGCGAGGAAAGLAANQPVVNPGSGCSASAANCSWQQITLNAAMLGPTDTFQSIYAAKDSYVYVGTSVNGTWRARISALEADPANGSAWSRIDSGFPPDPLHGGTAYPTTWAEDSSGKLYAALGETATGYFCTYCVVGKWNGTSWTFSSNPAGMRMAILSMTFDGSGNLYVNDRQAAFYKSTDGGATFGPALITDAYTRFGFTSGWVYASKIINGLMYWGGEGPYMVSPLDFSTGTAVYGNAGFKGNATVIASDGTASTAPTYILEGSRCDSSAAGNCLARYDAASGQWTSLPQTFTIRRDSLLHGIVAGEYLASFGAGGGAGGGGVMRSTDMGLTWALYDAGLPTPEQNFAGALAVSPVDGSKYLSTGTAASVPNELWYHP